MAAGLDRPEELDPSGMRKLLQLLGSLRNSPAGTVIYRQVEGMLDDMATSHLESQMAYAGFVNVLLEAFSAHHTPGTSAYLQIRLLQARLQPPLTSSELVTMRGFIDDCAQQMRDSKTLQADVMLAAINPLLAAFGIDAVPDAPRRYPEVESFATAAESVVPVAEPEEDLETEEDDAALEAVEHLAEVMRPISLAPERRLQAAPEAVTGPLPAEQAGVEDIAGPLPAEQAGVEETAGSLPAEPEPAAPEISEEIPAGQDLKSLHRSELEARRDDIAKLQATLGEQVIETIGKNEEFGVVLEKTLDELRQIEDPAELENVRWKLIREVEKALGGHHDLADKLDTTHHYLQLYESDSRQLTDELTRVRLLSLTDELTGLPNRRAFMRRLEDEVARVQRYGFPLSFVLIDLDHFKAVNDEHGHAAGDEVLRVYSRNILSIFRHHDMVARYGGEEFAVLLPNTDSDGTIRALNKVRRRANETRWQSNGTVSDVPTFSAGVSLYKPGESAGAFIERADKALYRAKRLGRNRIELDMTYQQESSDVAPRRRSSDQ
ncbi:MAG: GGDEF domain-containing protein [Gammaproteobacteria bacterium]